MELARASEETDTLEKTKIGGIAPSQLRMKPRTEKQLESFKKAQETRKENIAMIKEIKEAKKAEKDVEKLEIKKEVLKKKAAKLGQSPRELRELQQPPPPESDTSDSEPEVVVVRRKKVPKKKVVVVEAESEEEPEPQELEKVKHPKPISQSSRGQSPISVAPLLPQINKMMFY